MGPIALDDIPLLWRAEALSPLHRSCRPTGFAALDAALGGGWPVPSLIEVLCDQHGIGELRLILGLIKADNAATDGLADKSILWLAPPFELHSIGFAQRGVPLRQHWVCVTSSAADLQWAMTQGL